MKFVVFINTREGRTIVDEYENDEKTFFQLVDIYKVITSRLTHTPKIISLCVLCSLTQKGMRLGCSTLCKPLLLSRLSR